jgi:hypothetical protein
MGEIPKDLIFISAQPDVPYFHWQCQVYINNFLRMGIPKEQIYILFSVSNNEKKLSNGAEELRKITPNVFAYSDDRERKHYIPSIKPYLLYRFLQENPEKGKQIFLHDSDIIFNYLPDLDGLTKDNVQYMSDTTGYINFEYIMDCDKRYCDKHKDLSQGSLLREMIDVVGIEPSEVKRKSKDSGGAQYILKNQTWFVWYKIYKDSTLLYDKMKRFHTRYPIEHGEIQFWTAEMWSILWNLWWWNYETKVTEKLNFCWATDSLLTCQDDPILHMAGITENQKKEHFFKGEFINQNPIELIVDDYSYFDYVNQNSSTLIYVDEIKKIIS